LSGPQIRRQPEREYLAVHYQRTPAVKQASLEPSFVPAQNMPSEISCVVGGYPLPDTPALSDPRGTREANE